MTSTMACTMSMVAHLAPLTDKERRERWRPTEECRCPLCAGAASRVPRRPIDVLTGLFRHTRRYRCRTIGCSWTGNRTTPQQENGLIGWV